MTTSGTETTETSATCVEHLAKRCNPCDAVCTRDAGTFCVDTEKCRIDIRTEDYGATCTVWCVP